jgi:hypothetical protein
VVAFTNAAGLAAGAWALGRAVTLGTPLVVVALGETPTATVSGVERAGVATLRARGEADFAVTFSRAFLAGRPAVVTTAAP